jgi:hypothetical protein
LPVIPLVGDLYENIPEPVWPRYEEDDVTLLERALNGRIDHLLQAVTGNRRFD